ncbi:MAG: lpxH [Ramlibacter sp.]|jgi:UDP-2,3-diacylglucosamine hydrolase|uniref:UDP-2,3-diacylglucosamine diphosphatase n=1 Tax=Ramlibacter sp. TaxID=1917967 RepID=UPI0026250777|nr:UDP-2,3-diacylglucosamine diphosphatase [Ramlibacter sp.]MDB5753453.1 lpxH [Ramlibacter sp.]
MVAAPRAQELLAPAAWRTVECISDLHLQPSDPATFEAWRSYMDRTGADALFILGDLFEAWVGDDAAREPGFDADCALVLQRTAQRLPLFLMHGNRDFLLGQALAAQAGLTLLADPTVLQLGEHRWLLSHGDALCVDDTEYLAFRDKVRSPRWQSDFLAQPLQRRQQIARGLRGESEEHKRNDRHYPDVDSGTALQWLRAADAPVLVHGHTHKPADHPLDGAHRRIVLSDWDGGAQPPRLQALRLDRDGAAQRIALA